MTQVPFLVTFENLRPIATLRLTRNINITNFINAWNAIVSQTVITPITPPNNGHIRVDVAYDGKTVSFVLDKFNLYVVGYYYDAPQAPPAPQQMSASFTVPVDDVRYRDIGDTVLNAQTIFDAFTSAYYCITGNNAVDQRDFFYTEKAKYRKDFQIMTFLVSEAARLMNARIAIIYALSNTPPQDIVTHFAPAMRVKAPYTSTSDQLQAEYPKYQNQLTVLRDYSKIRNNTPLTAAGTCVLDFAHIQFYYQKNPSAPAVGTPEYLNLQNLGIV